MKKFPHNTFFYLLIVLIYIVVTLLFLDKGFFWDTKLTSIEAHKIYPDGFSKLLTPEIFGISVTGYHFPLISIITAFLWKIFGYQLWVLHVFMLIWAGVFIWGLKRVLNIFVPLKYHSILILAIVVEPTVLAQFAIASPDFILLSSFILTLAGILEKRIWLTLTGFFFLCFISMRGTFAGIILFLVYFFYQLSDKNNQLSYKKLLPFFVVFGLLVIYYSFYFISEGWFLTDKSPYKEHYSLPGNILQVLKNVATLFFQIIENGRIFLFILIAFVIYKLSGWKKLFTSSPERFLIALALSLYLIFFAFTFLSKMAFSGRYFMPQFTILTIVTFSVILRNFSIKFFRYSIALAIIFEITGNLWAYPDTIAKSWDTSLAHYPYYQLREECFSYIDTEKYDYNDISSGFCFSGDRKFAELKNGNKVTGTQPDRKYFIYSNISNIDDNLYTDLHDTNKWMQLQVFKKGFVKIIFYEKKE